MRDNSGRKYSPKYGDKLNQRICFLGAGNMAEALICGLLNSGIISASKITATDLRKERLDYCRKKFGINVTSDNFSAVRDSDLIFVAVKPMQIEALLFEIGRYIRAPHLVISIAAGVTTGYIEKFFKSDVPVIRCMPNTPALLGEGAIVVCPGKDAKQSHVKLALKIFSTVGIAIELPEKKIDAVTALSGSGPAYVFYLAEALERAGREIGIEPGLSDMLSRQTIFGAGKMLSFLKAHPSELRKNVTSPGGTTEAAIEYLETKKFSEILVGAVKQAYKKARQLSK